MNYVHLAAAFLQGQLGSALIYLLVVTVLDVLLGVLRAFRGKAFDLRKIGDFVVTTVGFEKVVAFLGALALMFLRHDVFTAAAVTVLATFYATAVLPDLYEKLSGIFFAGKLPATPAPAKP